MSGKSVHWLLVVYFRPKRAFLSLVGQSVIQKQNSMPAEQMAHLDQGLGWVPVP